MVVGVIISASLLLLAIPLLFQLTAEQRLTEKSYKSLVAMTLAEAGVERAIWELNYGDISSWNGDSSMRTISIASFQAAGGSVIGDIDISVQDPEGESPVVEAVGSVILTGSNTIEKTIRIVLESQGNSIFNFGMFGDEGVEFKSNARIDSYDSRLGPYGGDNVNWQGHVGANATHYGCIELNSNAKLYGDAVSGPGADPDEVIITRSNAHIYGEKEALSSEKEIPSVSPPEGLPWRGSYYLGSNSQDTISESGEYTSFKLESNAQVTITADVIFYITGAFSMSSNTKLKIAEGVSVTMYLRGTFEQTSNTEINSLTEDPTQLVVLGTDSFNGEMVWRSNSKFYGGVYVPKADVNYRSNSHFYGSIVAKSVELASNARVHYDEALSELDISSGGESSSYTIKSWQEKLN